MKQQFLRMSLGLALAAALSFGQGGRRGGDRILEDLNLSEEQKPKVQAIMKEQREALKAARDKNASREDMKAIQEQTHEKLKGVLNEEQLKKVEEARGKMRKGAKRRGA
jgi:Spy/CpxP family protein refolding chaperone